MAAAMITQVNALSIMQDRSFYVFGNCPGVNTKSKAATLLY
jgi:hypothetical protein